MLLFIIPAIVSIIIFIVTRSQLWAIVSFFVTMGIVAGAGSRRYRRSTKRSLRLDANVNVEDYLNKLEEIGTYKNGLPFHLRGWCNALGLYVQLQNAAGMKRLQAGEEKTAKIDARTRWEEPGNWKVTKYKPGSWERLIEPTLEIASFLHHSNYEEEDLTKLKEAIKRYEFFGDISSLQLLNEATVYSNKIVSVVEETGSTGYDDQPYVDPLLHNRVEEITRVEKQHDAELEDFWDSTTPDECANLMVNFLDELRHNWPNEYPQLNPERLPDTISKNFRDGITRAYKVGYMRGKGWISQEHLVDFTLYLGDKLASDIMQFFKDTKSNGNAFASGYVAVTVQGYLKACQK